MNSPLMALIRRRRSVRRFSPRAVDRALIDQCVEAARLAPSACNAQPWNFLIIDRPELIAKVSEAAFSGIYASNRFAAEAPVLVIMLDDQKSYLVKAGDLVQHTRFSLLDMGIAGEHFVLRATELGLGTCWLGWFNARRLRKILNLPRGIKIVSLLCVGYPLEEPQPVTRRRELEEVRRYL